MAIDPKEITIDTPEEDLPEYWEAEAVREIAEELIPEHHADLEQMSIIYIFQKKAPKHGDRVRLGMAQKKSKKDQVVANILGGFCHFVITIGWEKWCEFDDEKRLALVDHELTHCSVEHDKDGNPRPQIRHHDVEEFHEIIERRGLWNIQLENTKKVIDQLQLDLFQKAGDRVIEAMEKEAVA